MWGALYPFLPLQSSSIRICANSPRIKAQRTSLTKFIVNLYIVTNAQLNLWWRFEKIFTYGIGRKKKVLLSWAIFLARTYGSSPVPWSVLDWPFPCLTRREVWVSPYLLPYMYSSLTFTPSSQQIVQCYLQTEDKNHYNTLFFPECYN